MKSLKNIVIIKSYVLLTYQPAKVNSLVCICDARVKKSLQNFTFIAVESRIRPIITQNLAIL